MKNLNVMNAALMALVLFLAVYILPPLLHIQAKVALPSVAKPDVKEEKTVETQPPSPTEYTSIAEQNIFHPERKIPAVTAAAAPLPKPEFVLFGTLITGDVSLAYVEDLKAPAKGKRQRALRKGEVISGFTLKEIDADKVVMTRGDEKIEVKITDKARSRGAAAGPAQNGPLFQPAPGIMQPPVQQPPQTQLDEMRKRRATLRYMPKKP